MKMHEILPECLEVFKRLEEKIDSLVSRADRINGRYEKHIEEGICFRTKITEHEQKLNLIMGLRQWWLGAILTIVFAIISLAVVWGGMLWRVGHLEEVILKAGKITYQGKGYEPSKSNN